MNKIILLGLSGIVYFSLKTIMMSNKCKNCKKYSFCCNTDKLKTTIFKLEKK